MLVLKKPAEDFTGGPYFGAFGCWADVEQEYEKNPITSGFTHEFGGRLPDSVIYAAKLDLSMAPSPIGLVLVYNKERFLFQTKYASLFQTKYASPMIAHSYWDPFVSDAIGVFERFERIRALRPGYSGSRAVLAVEPFFRAWLEKQRDETGVSGGGA